jgi:hypothetical protein
LRLRPADPRRGKAACPVVDAGAPIGKSPQTESTSTTELGVTLAGRLFEHPLCVTVTPYSNRQSAPVAAAIQLGKPVTPRGMRRTYQDLARAAEMKDLVTRAISGHATEQMQQHYSTVDQTDASGDRQDHLARRRPGGARGRWYGSGMYRP